MAVLILLVPKRGNGPEKARFRSLSPFPAPQRLKESQSESQFDDAASDDHRSDASGAGDDRSVDREATTLPGGGRIASVGEPYGQGAAGLGLTFAANVAAFALLGVWLDRQFDSNPWATLGCSLFGVFSGMTWLVVKAGAASRPSTPSSRSSRKS